MQSPFFQSCASPEKQQQQKPFLQQQQQLQQQAIATAEKIPKPLTGPAKLQSLMPPGISLSPPPFQGPAQQLSSVSLVQIHKTHSCSLQVVVVQIQCWGFHL